MKKERFLASLLASAVCFSSAVMPFGRSDARQPRTAAHAEETKPVYTTGDVDGDGAVNSSDASLILIEYSASLTGKETTFTCDEQRAAADIDKDGSVDSSDASLVLRYYSYNATGGKLDIESYLKGQDEPATTTVPVTTAVTKPAATETAAPTSTKNNVKTTAAATNAKTTAAATNAKTTAAATNAKTTAAATNAKTTAAATNAKTTAAATNAKTTAAATNAKTTAAATNAKTTAAPTTAKTTVKTTNAPVTTASAKTTTKLTTRLATTAAATTKATKPVTTAPANYVKVEEIRITRKEVTIDVGESDWAAIVSMLPSNATNQDEIWSCSDESIAVVDDKGWVTGIKEGTCVVTVKCADNEALSAEIKVTIIDTKHVTGIRLSRNEMTVQAGYGDLAATVTMLPPTAVNKNEIWESSNEEVAIVDSQGWVMAKKPGNAVITVKSEENPAVYAFVLLTVTDGPGYTIRTTAAPTTAPPTTTTVQHIAPGSITVSPEEMNLAVGEQKSISMTLLPANATNKSVNWNSSNTDVATVDANGKVTAVGIGNCIITVNSTENASVKANVVVNVKAAGEVTGIVLSKYEIEIPVGGTDISRVTMLPYTAANQDELWTTSNPAIATVDKYGWVTGVSAGDCIVTVFSADTPSVKAEIKVRVTEDASDDPIIPDFSSIVPGKSTSTHIAFMTPIPQNAVGKFSVMYVITDSAGKKTSITSPTVTASTAKYVTTMVTSDTNEFTATAYLIDENTQKQAIIGKYKFVKFPRDAITESENIPGAFSALGALQ